MDFSEDPKPSPRREVHLQGPRPTPLKVSKDSHKIRKPPVAPAQHHHHHHPPPPPPQHHHHPRAPVIIYTVSPKVIHADPGDFMTLVQRLTGPSPTGAAAPPGSLSPGPAGPLSPAARFAAIERGCLPPNPHNKPPLQATIEDMADQMGISAALDMVSLPGILSPFPNSLPGISPSYFSSPPSVGDLDSLAFLNEMSPVFRGGNRGFVDGPFLLSPNNLLFTPTLPSPGALWDILGQL